MSSKISKIVEFASHLRKINGLYLFKIFTKYTCITDIDRLFNHLAEKEKEADTSIGAENLDDKSKENKEEE